MQRRKSPSLRWHLSLLRLPWSRSSYLQWAPPSCVRCNTPWGVCRQRTLLRFRHIWGQMLRWLLQRPRQNEDGVYLLLWPCSGQPPRHRGQKRYSGVRISYLLCRNSLLRQYRVRCLGNESNRSPSSSYHRSSR